VITQVYGITTPEDAAMVAALGPDHVGVVLDEGYGTWDAVDERGAKAIVRELDAATVVGLSLSLDADEIMRTVDTIGAQIAHVVRVTDAWQPDDVSALRDRLGPVRLMCTVGVRDVSAIAVAQRFAPVCDFLLLDTAHPSTGVVGATGFTHDWSVSAALVDAVTTPVVLAGGLGPDNVVAAIEAVHPAGVDSETNTSRLDDRRRKDPAKVERFLALARAATAG
jgi:phosphoribosylanthranilate isomerase